ncbi:MAG: hypothetical protein RLY43_30 [Bacteroidota bacterium]|jgi:hypothetical protein
MLNQPPNLSKKEKKKLKEEYLESRMERILIEVDKQPSVSSWDFVNYISRYKNKDIKR